MDKIFDAHFHIIDPNYPLVSSNGFVPDFYTVTDYQKDLKENGLTSMGGAVVSGSFQGHDQGFLINALSQLGPSFVGVTQLPTDVSDSEIESLNGYGVRAIRFPMYRDLTTSLAAIRQLAQKVYSLFGWRAEFYVDLANIDDQLEKLLFSLPKVSIDHLGMGKISSDALAKYAAAGIALRVSGFGRVAYKRDEIPQVISNLYHENPHSLIFGTDFPGTRTKHRFSSTDISLIKQALDNNQTSIDRVLYQNGAAWYLKK